MSDRACIHCFSPLGEGPVCPHCGFDHAAYAPRPNHLRPGVVLRRRYMVGRALGQGGFGITYAGYDTTLNIRVAVKEYFPEGAVWRESAATSEVSVISSQGTRESFDAGLSKFLNEAQALARLDDIPGIVRVRDYFPENGTAYIVMEFVEGVTLRTFLRRLPRRPGYREALDLLAPVAAALERVHARGFVHRDVSPDNIMIDKGGRPVLLDFGAVKTVTEDGNSTQTPIIKRGFSPNEMYSVKGKIGRWSDVYSYCATLYYVITGQLLDEPMDRMEDDTADEGLEGLVSPAQKAALLKGLAIQPKDRCQSVAELTAALNACRDDPPRDRDGKHTDGTADETVVLDKPADETVVLDKPADETVVLDKPADETVVLDKPADETVVLDKPADETEIIKEPASEKKKIEKTEGATETKDKDDDGTEPPPRPISKKLIVFFVVAVIAALCVFIGITVNKSSDKVSVDSSNTASTAKAPSTTQEEAEEPSESTPQSSGSRVLMGYDDYGKVSVFGNTTIKRSEIVSVEFLDSLSGKPTSGVWDVSEKQDGSVWAWTEPAEGGYALYLGADGHIIANANCYNMFYGEYHEGAETQTDLFVNLKSIRFNGVVDTSGVTDMSGMFFQCKSLQTLDVSSFNTSQVTNMFYMFCGCKSLQNLDLSSFDTFHVKNMGGMFDGCESLQTLNVSSFNTSRVTDMWGMFQECESLQTLDVSNFDTSQVTDMRFMFNACKSLQTLDLRSFSTPSVEEYIKMFGKTSCEVLVDSSKFTIPIDR